MATGFVPVARGSNLTNQNLARAVTPTFLTANQNPAKWTMTTTSITVVSARKVEDFFSVTAARTASIWGAASRSCWKFQRAAGNATFAKSSPCPGLLKWSSLGDGKKKLTKTRLRRVNFLKYYMRYRIPLPHQASLYKFFTFLRELHILTNTKFCIHTWQCLFWHFAVAFEIWMQMFNVRKNFTKSYNVLWNHAKFGICMCK